MYGTPHGKIIKLGIIGRRPAAVPHPEPLLSRAEAVMMKLIVVLKEEPELDKAVWHETRWMPFELRQFKGTKSRPPWCIVLYGRDRTDSIEDVVAVSPVDTLAVQPDEAHSLDGVLQVLSDGTVEDKTKLLLSLHKRFHHKPAQALRTLLHRSGVPLRTLSLVETACDLCHICKRWSATGTRPAARTSLAYSFNESVYIDVVFFDDGQMFLFSIDEAIRYLVIAHIEAKSFEHLETVFRRAWITQFGPPKQIISDKEGSLAGEMFGAFCDKLGIKRILYTAGDDLHTRLGVLDRRVKLFRQMAPRLADSLAEDSCLIEPEDLAGEIQLSINLLPVGGKHSPYECLFGVPPNDVLDLELDSVASFSEATLPFYKHQLIRVRATQSMQESILQDRVNRSSRARPRTENALIFAVGTEVDVYKHALLARISVGGAALQLWWLFLEKDW